MARVKQIIHANIVVRDIERSVRFYTEYLGARVVRDWPGESPHSAIALGFEGVPVARWHAYMLRFGEGDDLTFPQIDLLQWIDPPSEGEPYDRLNHVGIARIALEVEDIQGLYEELIAKGVEFISPPVSMNPATERGRRTKICCLKDPDGVVIELVGRVSAEQAAAEHAEAAPVGSAGEE